jgi:hypothetical protein
LCPLTGGGQKKWHGTRLMAHGDLLEVQLCMVPTRPLLDL